MTRCYLAGFLLVTLCASSFASAQPPSPSDCISVASSDRVPGGQSVYRDLPRGLEFRLAADGGRRPDDDEWNYWDISVGPAGDRSTDYMWISSPPWPTAPHRVIGAGYGLSARDSVRYPGARQFRFVLNAADYAEARAYYDGDNRNRSDVLQQVERLGKGTLTLEISNAFVKTDASGKDTNFIEWFEFSAVICIPKN